MSAIANAALAKALAAAKKINATPGYDDPDFDEQMQRNPLQDQATKHARKIYAGGLPANSPHLTDESLMRFFNEQLERTLPVKEPGDIVLQCFLGPEKRYAFLEHRSITEAAYTLTLDGMYYEGHQLKIRRPQDYNQQLAEDQQKVEVQTNSPGTMLYKHLQSNSTNGLNPAAIDPDFVSPQVENGPNKAFVGGFPHHMTDEECKDILKRFGPLKSFHLVKERDLVTGEITRSKGFCFCEWKDPNSVELALVHLNGQPIGEGRVLTVRRAIQKGNQGDPNDSSWSGPSLGLNVPGGQQIPTASPLALANQVAHNNALMLTNGANSNNKLPRYGHMGNLGFEAASAFLAGRLPFQGSFHPLNPHVDGVDAGDDVTSGGFDGGASALFPGEIEFLNLRVKMNQQMHFEGTEAEMKILDEEIVEMRHKLWDVMHRKQLLEKYGKPSRIVGLANVIDSPNDMNEIQEAIDRLKNLVEDCLAEVKYALYHPVDRGIVILEMDCICDAYRVLRSLHGRFYRGREIKARFTLMPPDVKQASLMRLKTELDSRFVMNSARLAEHRKAKQQRSMNRLQRYLTEVQPKWIDQCRIAAMKRKRDKERMEEAAMAAMSGEQVSFTRPEDDSGPHALELFPEQVTEINN